MLNQDYGSMITECVNPAASHRMSPLLGLAMAGCRTVWFPSISTTHFVFRSFSGVEQKVREKSYVIYLFGASSGYFWT